MMVHQFLRDYRRANLMHLSEEMKRELQLEELGWVFLLQKQSFLDMVGG